MGVGDPPIYQDEHQAYVNFLLELAASPYEGNGASPLSDGRPPLIGGAEAPEEKQRGRLQQNQKEKLAVFYTK